jgi:hypothetical protein
LHADEAPTAIRGGVATLSDLNDGTGQVETLVSIDVPIVQPLSVDKQNLEKFSEFEFEQGRNPGQPFCPEINKPFRAVIERGPGRSYFFELSRIEAGNPATDQCLPDTWGVECAVIRRFPRRPLTHEEAAQVRRVFRGIKIREVAPDPATCTQPCRLITARWDKTTAAEPLSTCLPPVDGILDGKKLEQLYELFDLLFKP